VRLEAFGFRRRDSVSRYGYLQFLEALQADLWDIRAAGSPRIIVTHSNNRNNSSSISNSLYNFQFFTTLQYYPLRSLSTFIHPPHKMSWGVIGDVLGLGGGGDSSASADANSSSNSTSDSSADSSNSNQNKTVSLSEPDRCRPKSCISVSLSLWRFPANRDTG
jgi:hypothetical protein